MRAAEPAAVDTVMRAARAVGALADELAIEQFVGSVLVDSKPRLLLRFAVGPSGPLADLGPDVVLKVYGDRPRGEGPVLHLWRGRGVHTPRVRFGEHAGCSWVALEYLPLSRVAPRGRAEILALTAELAGCATRMHQPAAELTPVLRPLERVMLPRWEAAVRTLRAGGYAVPEAWHSRARTAYATGMPTVLHGDLGLPNLAHDADGRLVVYDASALHGRASFDAARWAARTGSSSAPPTELARLWTGIERLPWGPEDDELLATECVLEAGSRAGTRTTVGSDVLRLLDEAHRLFAAAGPGAVDERAGHC